MARLWNMRLSSREGRKIRLWRVERKDMFMKMNIPGNKNGSIR